jgi:hypothetical protein
MRAMKASEFGGSDTGRNGVQPSPHTPTASEKLHLLYRTGDMSGLTDPDHGEAFSGLLPLEILVPIKEAEGFFIKGEIWEEMEAEAQIELTQIQSETPPST